MMGLNFRLVSGFSFSVAPGVDSFDSLSEETVTLTGGDAMALPSPEESYEQQLNAVKGLVAEDPGRVAQVIKRWINEE